MSENLKTSDNPAVVKLLDFFNESVEYLTVSTLLAVSMVLVAKSWRKSRIYFIAAIIFGTVLGFVANRTPLLTDYDFLLSMLGAIVGPATLVQFQHKNIFEVIKEIKELKKDVVTDETDTSSKT